MTVSDGGDALLCLGHERLRFRSRIAIHKQPAVVPVEALLQDVFTACTTAKFRP